MRHPPVLRKTAEARGTAEGIATQIPDSPEPRVATLLRKIQARKDPADPENPKDFENLC
jgi:hypothetical protein